MMDRNELCEELERALAPLRQALERIEAHQGTLPVGLPLKRAERLLITHTVRACGGNVSEAARTLGVSRNTLYLKLKAYGDEE